jgi:pSer/pThr/pTyr-binding forkhead associated (FHA) protein
MQVTVAICKTCGRDNQSLYKFCLSCGAELEIAESVPATPPESEETTDKIPHAALSQNDELLAAVEAGAEALGAPPASNGPARAASAQSNGEAHGSATPSLLSGAAPAGMRLCPNCGNAVPLEFTFCGQCGGRVDAKPPPPAPTTGVIGRIAAQQSAPHGRLILIRPDGTEGGVYNLHEGENIVGRSAGALFEADGYLSPRHAQLVLNAAGLVIRDLGSLNGVYIKLTEETQLSDGDVFRIGQELLRFDEIPAPLPLDDGTDILGSPNPGYWGRLALVIGPDHDGSAFPMFGDAVLLGRERGDILFPEDGYVSGQHARVSLRDDGYWLADLNSSNGTFLRLRGERQLASGGSILLGQQLFRVALP